MNANEPLMKCRESATFCQKCLKYDKHYKSSGHLFIGWATDHRASVRDHQKAMGLDPYIDERKTERALRGEPDHDMLQP